MASIQPLQEKAYEYLKEKILSGQFLPNVIYSETKLAKELNISRTPMKDALGRLSQNRFIDIIPSKGFCLHQMTKSDIWDTYQFRTAIEGFCAVQLSLLKDSDDGRETLGQLNDNIISMRLAIENGETLDTILGYDLKFHQNLVAFSRNKEFIQNFESYNHRLKAIAMESFQIPGRPAQALIEHETIFTSIVNAKTSSDMNVYFSVMHHMEASRDICLSLKTDD